MINNEIYKHNQLQVIALKYTKKRSSLGEKDLVTAKTFDKRTGSLSLKPYTFSSNLSPYKETEVSNLATLACKIVMVYYRCCNLQALVDFQSFRTIQLKEEKVNYLIDNLIQLIF